MATNRQLELRIAALETAVKALGDVADLSARLAALEQKECPQQAELDAIKAALAVLTGDHVPTP